MLDETKLDQFEERLGHRFVRRQWLLRALTHKSHAHEARGAGVRDNETLEFLGDGVLGFVIGDMLFRRFDALDEGALSKMKAHLVSAPMLAKKARLFGVGEVILLGVGEERSGGRKKDSLLADLLEAAVAAVYLDGGIDAARELIERTFGGDLDSIDVDDLRFHDYKTALQEAAQGRGLHIPEYSVIEERGPDHAKRFVVEVRLRGEVAARGQGSSKKEAQQEAARTALEGWPDATGMGSITAVKRVDDE